MNSIGLIGGGFIGMAIYHAFCHYTDVKVYDIDPKLATHDYDDTIAQDIILLALPTPMRKNGSVDLSIVEGAIERISENLTDFDKDCSSFNGQRKPLVIKSTMPPGACADIQRKNPDLCILYVPEFLTERTATLDFIQQTRIIIGSQKDESAVDKVRDLFRARFPRVPIVEMNWDEASLTKYTTNLFFCVKLSFFNEVDQVAERLGLDGQKVIDEVLNDGRIGRSHHMTPGRDGKKGWGGSCFLKDCNGFMKFAKKLGVDPKMAKAAWKKNLEVRPTVWDELKEMKGRALSDD